ncbi:hypothetical protein [Rhizobium sp. PL01]|uniref:hypothetical protein n=1 Tax=Rhizobium sp. PL01 TaxID=3085631 RepID=UPI002980C230|nr:hypothetical protein [Rhizobium sp. PL01]MDW5314497.1 hypothetical protein [Rhizobium sp. PL01]
MKELKEFTLAEFLTEQGTNFHSGLPLVHSTESANIWKMLGHERVEVTPCDTFTGENLAYFFHGRPAYRKFHKNPQDWELPFVLVLKSTCLLNIRRIFPFDSGAFQSSRLPSYVSRFNAEGYDVASNTAAIDLLVDIFFGGDSSYFHGKAKSRDEVSRRNGLGMRHAQVLALCALYNREHLEADDRSLAIEVQTDLEVSIKDNLLGVVLPRSYFDDKNLKKYFKERGVQVRQYDVYPINTEAYVSIVYEEVKAIYKKLRLIDG